jgi:isopenicillin N synthase-like dioxygenase
MAASPSRSTSLPVIDLSPYLDGSSSYPPTEAQKKCSAAIHEACVEYGFFYLAGLGLHPDEMDRVLTLAREFFALPNEEKDKISIANQDMARGSSAHFSTKIP